MKKIIATLLFLIILMSSSFAQSSEHLKFKGVPIDGTLNEYVSKMKQAGLQLVEIEDGVAMMNGNFAGYNDCQIGIKSSQKQDLVYEVMVIFPIQSKWAGLNNNYENLKSMLLQKYGNPIECVEEFAFLKEKSKDEINKIMMDNVAFLCNIGMCTWYSSFETLNGSIELSIENHGFSYFVLLRYYDKINYDKYKDAAMEDL